MDEVEKGCFNACDKVKEAAKAEMVFNNIKRTNHSAYMKRMQSEDLGIELFESQMQVEDPSIKEMLERKVQAEL